MEFIPFSDAYRIVIQHAPLLSAQSVPLGKALHQVLAEDLVADRDFPPFDRVTMDGIAIRHAAFAAGQRNFTIQALAPAGAPQRRLEKDTDCIEVMTGAMLPLGANAVIRYEDLDIQQGEAHLMVDSVTKGQNIHTQGLDGLKGDIMVTKGTRLGTAELSIAATVGKSELSVLTPPLAAVISTGDELVGIDEQPETYQIRSSNIHSIQATLSRWGVPSRLMHLPDDRDVLREKLKTILSEHTLVILSGGVSKGKFDYLPEVLTELGVERHFYKVKQRPGKPFWFGTHGPTAVFALPGNPVSTYMCTHVYVRAWLAAAGHQALTPRYARLAEPISFRPELTYFIPCRTRYTHEGVLEAIPSAGNGSGDFANLVGTDGFLQLPPNQTEFPAGEAFPFIPYRDIL